MKRVVEYKLHGDSVPYFIAKGGFFFNSGKMIGVTKDNSNCYIPPEPELVTFHTKEELVNHIKTLAIFSITGATLTEEQKATLADEWWDAYV